MIGCQISEQEQIINDNAYQMSEDNKYLKEICLQFRN